MQGPPWSISDTLEVCVSQVLLQNLGTIFPFCIRTANLANFGTLHQLQVTHQSDEGIHKVADQVSQKGDCSGFSGCWGYGSRVGDSHNWRLKT